MKYKIKTQPSRDANLTEFSKATLDDRYLHIDPETKEKESYQGCFERVSTYYADDQEHAQRLYDYISKLWFMPSTPIISNGGTDRGLPISCFLNETEDHLKGIVDMWTENVWLASKGGGIGSYWGNIRAINEEVQGRGKTSGIIPFIVVQNALTLAISQGSLRRGSTAVYLPVDHPEIEEFLDLRKPIGGDPNRKALNLHHGVVITDKFMRAVENGEHFDLISPKDNSVISSVNARDLWIKILSTRIETGEPYIIFIDTVNKNRPDIYENIDLEVKMSNLCAEITLATGIDYNDKKRTAVCCLILLKFRKIRTTGKMIPSLVEDIMRFLRQCAMQDFITKAPASMANAAYSANQERSVGLGVMGFHSLLQNKMIPFGSPMAKDLNLKIFKKIREQANAASIIIAKEKGNCEDINRALSYNYSKISLLYLKDKSFERFTHKLAIAPTASISIIAGSVSAGIDPITANIYTHRTLSGTFVIRNPALKELLGEKGKDNEDIWTEIINSEGSVQDLEFLTDYEKEVFRTASEIDQNWVIELASDRQKYICQSQSLNLFLNPDINKKALNKLHFLAWRKGIKSLYYCRTKSLARTDKIGIERDMEADNYDNAGCLACQ